jgi:hypothetical protein
LRAQVGARVGLIIVADGMVGAFGGRERDRVGDQRVAIGIVRRRLGGGSTRRVAGGGSVFGMSRCARAPTARDEQDHT